MCKLNSNLSLSSPWLQPLRQLQSAFLWLQYYPQSIIQMFQKNNENQYKKPSGRSVSVKIPFKPDTKIYWIHKSNLQWLWRRPINKGIDPAPLTNCSIGALWLAPVNCYCCYRMVGFIFYIQEDLMCDLLHWYKFFPVYDDSVPYIFTFTLTGA